MLLVVEALVVLPGSLAVWSVVCMCVRFCLSVCATMCVFVPVTRVSVGVPHAMHGSVTV